MNGSPIRAISLSAVLTAGFALLAASCGGTSRAPEVASVNSSSRNAPRASYPVQPNGAEVDAAVHCMRTHGLPNFPDPIVENGKKYFGFSVDSGVDTTSPVYQQADQYCERKYMHVGDSRTPKEKSQARTDALRYSACIRSHGAADFPDPDATGEIHVSTSVYLNTPKVKRAQQACKALFTGSFVFFVPFR